MKILLTGGPVHAKHVDKNRMTVTPEGYVFGTVAVREPLSTFVTTVRGKKELSEVVRVIKVEHDGPYEVHTVDGQKASLNAPLLHMIFSSCPDVHHIEHYHDQVEGLPTEPYAPPGTRRDSYRRDWFVPPRPRGRWSFNIEGHGCFLLFDKEGNQL